VVEADDRERLERKRSLFERARSLLDESRRGFEEIGMPRHRALVDDLLRY